MCVFPNGLLIVFIIAMQYTWLEASPMGLLPDTQDCGLRMRRESRQRFPRYPLQRNPLVSDPGMHHGTCATHVPWCMSGSLNSGDGENVPGNPGVCTARNFAYLVRGPWPLPYSTEGVITTQGITATKIIVPSCQAYSHIPFWYTKTLVLHPANKC